MRSLSSREVEGNGPMKPGNPSATKQEGCQFRRNTALCVPRDEGNVQHAIPLRSRGFFVPTSPFLNCGRNHVYGVRVRFIAYDSSKETTV